MSKRILTSILATLAMGVMLFVASPAWAQGAKCGPRAKVVKNLSGEKFKEQLAGIGQLTATIILELWRNPDTGTWTVITTHANGLSCVGASGDAWQEKEVLAGEPS